MGRTPQRFALAIALAAGALGAREARADDQASASALFDEGKALFAAGHYPEARAKLEASYQLSPLSGTAGLLAACHERTGQLASAWARYRESVVLAERSGNEERAAVARAKVAELEPRLARLTIDPPPGAARGRGGLAVTRNGEPIPDAALATPMPVDAGRQVVVATAPGRQRWSRVIEIADGQRRTVSIPELGPAELISSPRHRPRPSRSRPVQAWIGLALAGTGGAAVLAGGGFGIAAASGWKDAKDAGCTGGGQCPDASSRDKGRTASRRADVATALVGGGLALAATGIILFWIAPDPSDEPEPSARVSAAVDGEGLTLAVEGRF